MLTVCCVLVDGPVVGFNNAYVVRLERMVRRYLARDFRFVCFTDGTRGELPPPIETIRLKHLPPGRLPENGRGYWRKLELFNPKHGLEGRVLFLDLDVLVVATLDPIVDFPAALALTEDALVLERAHLNRDRYGRQLVRRFNSSVIVWDAGVADYLYTRCTPDDVARLSTDQDWIGEQAPEAVGMPLAWFPRLSHLVRDPQFAATGSPFPADAKVLLTKKPKNHDALSRFPWFGRAWGGW